MKKLIENDITLLKAKKTYYYKESGIDARFEMALSPLHRAVWLDDRETVQYLISRGANFNEKAGISGDSPLNLAAMRGCTEIAALLISEGALVNVKESHFGLTPLHRAAFCGYQQIAESLINAGAKIDVRDDKFGDTPLHKAAWKGNRSIIELLIANGADINAKANDGKTPSQIFKEKSNDNLSAISLHHPLGILRRYYEFINSKNMKDAYTLNSRRFVSVENLDAFKKDWSNNISVHVEKAEIIKRTTSECLVDVIIIVNDREHTTGKPSTVPYGATVRMVLENDTWLYDGGMFRSISPLKLEYVDGIPSTPIRPYSSHEIAIAFKNIGKSGISGSIIVSFPRNPRITFSPSQKDIRLYNPGDLILTKKKESIKASDVILELWSENPWNYGDTRIIGFRCESLLEGDFPVRFRAYLKESENKWYSSPSTSEVIDQQGFACYEKILQISKPKELPIIISSLSPSLSPSPSSSAFTVSSPTQFSPTPASPTQSLSLNPSPSDVPENEGHRVLWPLCGGLIVVTIIGVLIYLHHHNKKRHTALPTASTPATPATRTAPPATSPAATPPVQPSPTPTATPSSTSTSMPPPGPPVSFPIRNPYVAGNPIIDGALFFGRQDIFDFICEKITQADTGTAIVIYGGRRTGKTSVLCQIMNGRLGEGFVPVYNDLQEMADIDTHEFFERLQDNILKSLNHAGMLVVHKDFSKKDLNPYQLFDHLLDNTERALKHKSHKHYLLMLIDEYEILGNKVEKGHLSDEVFNYMRAIMQNRSRISFIFTGTRQLELLKGLHWPLMFNTAIYRKISFLDEKEARRLIEVPLAGLVKYDTSAVDRILRLTWGQPYFIQLICLHIVDIVNQKKVPVITENEVKEAVHLISRHPVPHMIYLWKECEPEERIVLAALSEIIQNAAAWVTLNDLEKIFSDEHITLTPEQIKTGINELMNNEYIERTTDDTYRFIIDLLRYWITVEHPLWKTAEEEGFVQK
ncbi:MAG: ankyrin repeat domain-containing protein [Candidatus Xenobiia bacterium LiM19]